MGASDRTITTERRGHVLLIGMNRPAKRNAFDIEMLDLLSMAYAELEDDADLRCGVLFAEGEMFTAGIDLATVGPKVVENGHLKYPDGAIDPLGVGGGRTRTKPMVVAVHGKCLTIGIELMLAADVRIASRKRDVRSDRDQTRHFSVRRRYHPFASGRRVGERDALASYW